MPYAGPSDHSGVRSGFSYKPAGAIHLKETAIQVTKILITKSNYKVE